MITTIQITDKKIWEAFLTESHIASSFFQSWNWGEFQLSLGNEILRLGIYDDGKLAGVAQGVIVRAKRGKYLYVRNGPVYSWESKSKALEMLQQLKRVAASLGLWFVRISPLVDKTPTIVNLIGSYPTSPMSDVDALDTWVLDLTQDEATILSEMRKSTRYDIRKAEKDGVQITYCDDDSKIDEFYTAYSDTILRNKWNGYSKDYIAKQVKAFARDKMVRTYFAHYEGKLVASSIFIYHADSSYYHYSGSITDQKGIAGPALIHWNNILHAKSLGLKEYNFWGIEPENKVNHPWAGLTKFKMGFGGMAKRWLPAKDIPVKSLHYMLTNLYEKWDKYRKGY